MTDSLPGDNFLSAFGYTLKNEGGFVPSDAGQGAVKYGLSASDIALYRRVPAHTLTEDDVRNLQIPEAQLIYHKLYWDRMNLDEIEDGAKATAIFDVGVNRGINRALSYVTNISDRLGTTVNQIGRELFIRTLVTLDINGYEKIIAKDPAVYEKYRKGWTARANRMLTLI